MSVIGLRRLLGRPRLRTYVAVAVITIVAAVAATHVAVVEGAYGHGDAAPLIMCLAVAAAIALVAAGVPTARRPLQPAPAPARSPRHDVPAVVCGAPVRAGPGWLRALQVFRE